jgi:hypothetical protein
VDTDGSFIVQAMHPGLFHFFVDQENMPEGWYVSSVTSGGRDVLRDGLEVTGAILNPIEITVANDGAEIQGVARDGDGALVPDARIVLIPPVNRRGAFASFPVAVADQSGTFVLEDVPPGEYRVLALEVPGGRESDPSWDAPEFLREFELRGQLLTVDPGAQLTLSPQAQVVGF